jgi:ABC-type molybdate transport system substrate-binding protein
LAPYGRAAVEFLDSSSITIEEERIIWTDKVSQCVHYALNGADLAFIPLSALQAEEMTTYNTPEHFLEIPQETYSPIIQAMVLLNREDSRKNLNDITEFYSFLLSPPAGDVLESFGYRKVGP